MILWGMVYRKLGREEGRRGGKEGRRGGGDIIMEIMMIIESNKLLYYIAFIGHFPGIPIGS